MAHPSCMHQYSTPFFFLFCSVVFHVIGVPVFVQPIEPTERHMDSFQFGVIMNKAAMNNCVQPRCFLSERICENGYAVISWRGWSWALLVKNEPQCMCSHQALQKGFLLFHLCMLLYIYVCVCYYTYMCVCVYIYIHTHTYFESESRSVVSSSLRPHGLYSPWNSPGQNTGVGSLSLLQKIFPIQGLNPGLLHCRQILYQLSYQGSPLYILY